MNKQTKEADISKIILFFLKRHIAIYSALMLLGIVIGVLEAVNLAVFIPMLNNLVGSAPSGTGGQEKILVQALYWLINLVPIQDKFVSAGMLFLLLTVIKGALSLWHEYLVAYASGNVLKQYRQELIERYRDAPLSYFDQQRAGALTYNLNMPPIMLSKLLYTLPRALIDFLRFFFVMALLFYVEPKITMEVTLFALILYFVVSRPLARYTYKLSLLRRSAEQEMSAVSTEWLRGVRPIRTAAAESHWIDGYSVKNEVSRSSYIKTTFLLASPRHVFELIAFSALFIGMILAYLQAPHAFSSHVATIGFFAMGLVRVLPSFATLARTPLDIKTMLPDVENLYAILKGLPDKENDGAIQFSNLKEAISLESVSVEHEGREKALDNVSLSILKGQVVAFVGSSGAGKTTLLNVLIGAQQPSKGRVVYDDFDLSTLNKLSLLKNIGYVGQDVLLFHGTIEQNIAYFKSLPMHAIKKAAEIAEISSFIESLPNGYQTLVGEAGVNFSGGQAQRLAIARAIVNNPEILILDEATSALDTSSEKMVVEALQHASENRTVIMVTHRLSTVRWADKIYVLDAGKIMESGSWPELANNTNSQFYKMCSEQHV
jgi:ABC-type multidrug transport system fused ATPase/permease subunit